MLSRLTIPYNRYMPIRILPANIASQIAAGEVVERPASVVKELVENALDAEARQISVSIKTGGQSFIEVADDGFGIPTDELRLAVERHATSKITQSNDLIHIETLGFRGEALASIASVSRVTLISRSHQEDLGAQLLVDAGQIIAFQPAGAPAGTLVRVENLFYNVPARLKFQKSETTEKRAINALVNRYSFCFPNVRFNLQHDNRMTLQTSGNGNYREVLVNLYGAEIARQMLEVNSEDRDLKVSGFVSPISVTRTNRRDIIFFVNKRPVQDPALTAAVLKGFHTFLMVGRFPIATLFLEIPSEMVDVNVHPTKAEVRFRQPAQVFSGLQNSIRRTLLAYGPLPDVEALHQWALQAPWNASKQNNVPGWGITTGPGWQNGEDFRQPTEDGSEELESSRPSAQPDLLTDSLPLLRPIGQVATAYLVAEGPDGLYLIDQHAAHERVLFERFMAQRSAQILSQSLLQPITVEFPQISAQLLQEHLPILEQLGFQVEAFGSHTFLVRAIPALLGYIDPAEALEVVVGDFEEDETPFESEIEARIIARVCKRAAIKAGQNLSFEEQRVLLLDLESCQSPRTCPHGRPTMIHLSVDLLERQFGRRGAR